MGIRCVKQREDLGPFCGDLRLRHGPVEFQEIVGLGLDNVTTVGGGERGLIGLHVQHVFDRVAEVSDAGPLEVVQHHSDVTPLADLSRHDGVVFQGAQDDRRGLLAHADRDTGELGDATEIVVAELHIGRGPCIVQRFARLQGHQDHGDVQGSHDGRKGGGGGVGEHVTEEQVEVGPLDAGQQGVGGAGTVNDIEIRDLYVLRFYLIDKETELLFEFLQQPVKLVPVLVKTDTKDADASISLFSALNVHLSHFR